jgi:CDP-diacylglycerol---serine O-phosphatidyltransferase
MKKHIPNLITSLNLTSGFVAIIYASGGNIVIASWLILAAMVFDFFDGFSSRMLDAYSDIGKELDSLADVVSFGVAPALIIYQLLLRAPIENALIRNIILFVPAIMPVCAALRLAKFNIDETQKTSFKGLPTPASALAVISIIIAAHFSSSRILASFINSAAPLIIFTIIISLLMVTRLSLLSLKTSHLRFRGNEGLYIMIILVVAALVIFGISALPLVTPLYLLSSLIALAIKQMHS